jgi:hypothetical protein
MWLLPWEKWLPAWIVGPAFFAGSVAALLLDRNLSWWEYILLPFGVLLGAWATYAWFKDGRHVFRETDPQNESSRKGQPK